MLIGKFDLLELAHGDSAYRRILIDKILWPEVLSLLQSTKRNTICKSLSVRTRKQ